MSSGGDSPRDELRDDLADHARELEPVARSAAGDDDVLVLRMQTEEEVLVRRVLEQAQLQRRRRPGSVREVPLGELTQELLVALGRLAVELVRVALLLEVVIAAEFEAGDAEDGESVVAALLDEQVEDRKALRHGRPEEAAADFEPERFPVFNVVVEEGRYYGFSGIHFQVSHSTTSRKSNPDELDRR